MRIPLCAALLALAAAGPAAASERYVPIAGAPSGGPAQFDRVFVQKTGPASARRVLVLVPGQVDGAGSFTDAARELVRRVPRLQVWALDPRASALEDTTGFTAGNADAALGYYLDSGTLDGRTFAPADAASAPFAREWGLRVAVGDLRRVVRAARAGGRRSVVLGGDAQGAETAVAYAAWSFAGRPGWRDLRGLLLLDGALPAGPAPDVAAARARLADIESGEPFAGYLPGAPPWATGVLAELAARYAMADAQGRSTLQTAPLLPAALRPPVSVTNEALLGFDFDRTTSPEGLRLLHVQAGGLAPADDPRRWQHYEATPIQRLARLLAHEPGNAVQWYYPRRLELDLAAAGAGRRTAATRLLGLALPSHPTIHVPLFVFQTDMSRGEVLRGARRLIRVANVPRWTLVHGERVLSHLDPLAAVPRRNPFLRTAAKFLRHLGG